MTEQLELHPQNEDIDIYAMWRGGRASGCPVIEAESLNRPTYIVLGFGDAEKVLRDNDTFSSSINLETMGDVMGRFMVGMDGIEHRRYRDLVAKAFRASALERWGADLVEPTMTALLDRIAPLGQAELVADLTYQFPVQIIAGILGVPVEDYGLFQHWAEDINLGPTDPERSIPASRALHDYLAPIIADRRENPTGDLISELVHAEIDGEVLDDGHLYGFFQLLLPAGAETTYRMLGNSLVALLTHPDALAEVTADRSLIPAVIEETLRWETSVTIVNRCPVSETEVAGVTIPVGSSVLVATSSANHDEARYDNADEWDLHRPVKPHLAFGTGRHQCLGMHLARLELRIALDAILDRLPNLRLDPAEPMPRVTGFAFRSPDRIPVLFDPS